MVPFSSIIKKVWKDVFFVVKAYCVLHVTENYLITLVKTEGASMLPTIDSTPSMFLAERISPRFGKVAHGDIVRLRSPQNPRESYGKRVIGLEGDSITYIADRGNGYKHETVVVPKGHVWVEGDNKFSSYDSRRFGPVPYGLIESKIFWRVWPRKDFGSFWNK